MTDTLTTSESYRLLGMKRNEWDELAGVYGDLATFDKVGPFTLVHLDGASEALRIERVKAFDPETFFFDKCSLCETAKREGGHVVYDGPAVVAPEPTPLDRLNSSYRELCQAVCDAIAETDARPALFSRHSPRGVGALAALKLIRRGIDEYATDADRGFGLVLDGVHPLLVDCDELGTRQSVMGRIWDHAQAVRALASKITRGE